MPSEAPAGRIARALGRAVRLRCPRCGQTPLFPRCELGDAGRSRVATRAVRWFGHWFRMRPACAFCGLRFERAQGYFVGAIYVNYAVTTPIAVGGALVLWRVAGLDPVWQLALWGPFVVVFPLWFFRWSRSLWLAVELLANPEP
ncbi:MAG: DUF983 domain-containing protein [Candidatus Rokubacteria bacterium]|nr:DUF983 domain-containing protein [Candidatus Rokubacteria bacterium]MBI2014823.1 DUF983 domain-containing protein [Candidatus Rokubacteria bacterium]MBI2157670.1 DUF983 domain-containing protein [Candidatus Rokubacteria bacterium]MBI4629027.1 DUF983 domain-containing protein [Candidatus Rokubacteria bacterium]